MEPILLTNENAEEVADRLRQLLNDQKFTFISFNQGFGFKPEIKKNQYLELGSRTAIDAITVRYSEKYNYSMITVCDSYGVWSISSSEWPQEHVFLTFKENLVIIKHRAGAGHRLYWVIVVE